MEPTKIYVETSADLGALKGVQVELEKTASAGKTLGTDATAAAQATDGLTVGGKELAEELKNTKKAADAATESKKQLKDGVKGVGKAFHGLAGIGKMMFHPIMLATYAVTAAMSAAVAKIREIYSVAAEAESMNRLREQMAAIGKAAADAKLTMDGYDASIKKIRDNAKTATQELEKLNAEINRQKDEDLKLAEQERDIALAKAKRIFANEPERLLKHEYEIQKDFIKKKAELESGAAYDTAENVYQSVTKAQAAIPEMTQKRDEAQKRLEEVNAREAYNKVGDKDKDIGERLKQAKQALAEAEDSYRHGDSQKQASFRDYLRGEGSAAPSITVARMKRDKVEAEARDWATEQAKVARQKKQAEREADAAQKRLEETEKAANPEVWEEAKKKFENTRRGVRREEAAGLAVESENFGAKAEAEARKRAEEAAREAERARREAEAEARRREAGDKKINKGLTMNDAPIQDTIQGIGQLAANIENLHQQLATAVKNVNRRVENLERREFTNSTPV